MPAQLSQDAPIEEKLAGLIDASEPIPVESGKSFGDEQALAFLAYWKILRGAAPADEDWLPTLLRHIYGEQRARTLLTLRAS